MYAFHFQLTEDDYFEYNLCHSFSIPKFRKKLMIQKFLFPVLCIVCAVSLGATYANPIIAYIIFGVAAIAFIVFFRQLIERNIRKSIKTIKESGKAPYEVDFKAVFEDEKIVTSSKDTEMSTSYSAIEKIVIGRNALYLYKNAISAFILPNRIFASNEEKEAFVQYMKQKTNAVEITGVTK